MPHLPFQYLPITERFSVEELDRRESGFLANCPRKYDHLPAPSSSLKLCIVVPMLNEESNILNLLQSMESQTLAAEFFELLLVDNNSQDRSAEMVIEFAKTSRIKIILIEEPEKGCLRAIRAGMDVAISRLRHVSPANEGWISNIDADDIVGPDWAVEWLAECTRLRADFLRGLTTLQNPLPPPIERVVKLMGDVENRVNGYAELLRLRFEEELVGAPEKSYPRWFPRITGPNFSISRAAYVAISGLNPRPPGDQSSHLANPLLRAGGIALQSHNLKTTLYRSNRSSMRNYEEAAGYGAGFGIGFGDMLSRAQYHADTGVEIDYPDPTLLESGFMQVLEEFQSPDLARNQAGRNFIQEYLDNSPDPSRLYNRARSKSVHNNLPLSKVKLILEKLTANMGGIDYRAAERMLQGREHLRQAILSNLQNEIDYDQVIADLHHRVKQQDQIVPDHLVSILQMIEAIPRHDLSVWYNMHVVRWKKSIPNYP